MKAYLNGIPFHVLDPMESSEWEVKVTEFVTKHPPIIRRMNKGPNRFCISALIVGKMAILTKDILIKTLDKEEPAKLIHPLFGIRQVVCCHYNVQGFSNSLNAYIIEMEFFEKEDSLGLLSGLTKMVSETSNVIESLAISFYSQMQILQELRFNADKFGNLVFQIKGFLTSPSGVGTVSDSLLSISLSESQSRLAKELMSQAGKGVINDSVFSYLWQRSLEKTKTKETRRQKTYPSLVASYMEHKDLEKAEEMACGASQPFAV